MERSSFTSATTVPASLTASPIAPSTASPAPTPATAATARGSGWPSSPPSRAPTEGAHRPQRCPTAAPTSGSPCRRRLRSMRHRHQHERLVVSFDDALGDLPHAGRVLLALRLRLERAGLRGDQHMLERAVRRRRAAGPDDARLVERLPGRVVLLPVGVAAARTRGHDDPGPGAVDAGLP